MAHLARIWDYWPGGKDNFAAGHEAAEKVLQVMAPWRRVARAGRAFLRRPYTSRPPRLFRAPGLRTYCAVARKP